MADLNQYNCTGRLTADAQMKTTSTGKELLEANIAVNYGFGDNKKVNFIKVNWWGNKGANLKPYLKRGALVACSGELGTNEWTGQDGSRHLQLILNVFNINLLAGKHTDDNTPAEQEPSTEDAVF